MKRIVTKIFDKKHRSRTTSYLIVIVAYIVITILQSSGNLSSLLTSLLVPTCCYITAALALNLVVGFSGELSLGHSGFMAVGAFTAVVVSGYLESIVTIAPLRLLISMLCGGFTAGIFGLLISIPVLQLEGDYLAIVTLAFCQIIKSLINNIYIGFDNEGFQFSFITNELNLGEGKKVLISGAMGATATTKIATFTAGVLLILFSLVVIYNLIYSRYGRAIMAARDNRIAAESIGINIRNIKTLAFVISTVLVGMAGALYALNYSSLLPAKFDYNLSILILVYIVLGGLGNINGTIIATTILYLLPELLRSLQDYRMLIYAVFLIVSMIVTNNPQIKERKERLLSRFKKGANDNE